ncbi:I78 family peptidase inhibitor [Pacificimonas sp. ICDLI1SI03]
MKFLTATTALLSVIMAVPALAAPLDQTQVERIVAASDRTDEDRTLDESRQPARALLFMQVEAGDRVLDMFSGGGYYAELLSRAVGQEGRVIAQNPPGPAAGEEFQEMIAARDFGGRLANVGSMNIDFMNMRLAPSSIDAALFHLTYHDLYFTSAEFGLPTSEPQEVLAELHRGLRPGGTVTVIDHVGAGDEPRADVSATHRIRPEVVKNDFRRAGFTLVAEETWFDNPDDDYDQTVFAEGLRGKTDRFALRFAKAGDPNAPTEVDMPEQQVAENGEGSCDASKVEDLIGKVPDEELRQGALATSGARTLRLHDVDQPVTMDFRADRLNLVLDPDSGAVVRVSCG